MAKNNKNTTIYPFLIIRACFEKIYKIEKIWIDSCRVSDIEMGIQIGAYSKLEELSEQFDEQGLNAEKIIVWVYKNEFEKKFEALIRKNLF